MSEEQAGRGPVGFTDVTFTFNGVSFPVEGVSVATASGTALDAIGKSFGVSRKSTGRYVTHISVSAVTPRGVMRLFERAARRGHRIPLATLLRRAAYGGRKGRRAWARAREIIAERGGLF
jgi:hypothetical protein